MKCETAFDRYLELDKNEHVPFSVTFHLLFCPTCRTSVRLLTNAERILAKPLALSSVVASPFAPELSPSKAHSDDPVIAAALQRIQASGLSYQPSEHHISLFRWLLAGVCLFAGFAAFSFTSYSKWSTDAFGTSFSIPFYLLCGLAVTIYGGLFVGTNIDFFVKKFGFEHTAEHTA